MEERGIRCFFWLVCVKRGVNGNMELISFFGK